MAIVIQTVSDSAQARRDLTQLKESVQGIQQSSERLSRNFVSLGKALIIGGGVLASARAFTKYSDAITNLENRLRFVTGSVRDATNAFAAISRIAVSTRNDIDSTARLYSRLSVAAREMGANQRQVAIVTKAVGQSIKLSGANSVEAANAIQQFAQAMGSGKLQGDEFRAIMEAAPSFAYEIAKGMGVSVSQMYELKEAGLLTNKLVFEAILKRSKEINAEFGKMNVTYSEAFTNLGNSLLLLFAAVKKAFLSADGGFAVTINGWAESIASFAQNFGFHLLRAQTRAYVFVVDTITMFTDLWKGIKDGAKVLWEIAKDFIAFLQPYLAAIGGFFLGVAARIYEGSGDLFFKFTAMLKKNDVTKALGEWLEKSNERLLHLFEKMGEVIASFDFRGALEKARVQLINFYRSLQQIDFSAMGRGILNWFRNFDLTEALQALRENLQRMWARLGQIDLRAFGRNVQNSLRKAFSAIKALNIMDYIPSMDQALAAIAGWAKKVVGWFAWIYDQVIGHSYIPDLVRGIIKWMEQLSGKPLGLVLAFAGAVTAAFSTIAFGNPFEKGLGAIKAMLPYALAIAGAAGVAGVAYKLTQDNGGAVSALNKLKEAFHSLFEGFLSRLEKVSDAVKSFFGPGKITTKVKEGDVPQPELVVAKEKRRGGFYQMFPEEYQVAVGLGIAAAVAGALMAFFNSGPLRTVLISLGTTVVAAGMGKGIDREVIWRSIAWGFEKVLELFDKGLRKLMGTVVSKDPFGFLLLIAKTSLLFKAGRDYFLGLSKTVATAPTTLAQNLVDRGVVRIQENAVSKMSKELRAAEEPFKNSLAAATSRYNDAVSTLAKQTNIVTGQPLGKGGAMAAVASTVGPQPLDAVGHQALQAVRDAERIRQNAADDLRSLDPAREKLKDAIEDSKTLKRRLKEASDQFKESFKNFVTGAGGAIGAGIGLQVGQDIIKGIENSKIEEAIDRIMSIGVTTTEGRAATREQVSTAVRTGDFSALDNVGKKIAKDIVAGIQPVGPWKQIGITIGAMAVGQFIGATLAAGLIAVFAPVGSAIVAAFATGGALAGAAIPLGIVAGIVIVGVLLYKYWDQIVALVKREFPIVFNVLKTVGEAVATSFRTVVNFFKTTWDNIVTSWNRHVVKPLESIQKFFQGRDRSQETPSGRDPKDDSRRKPLGGYATGGYVSGPGGPKSDDILAWLSNGEFVVNAQAAERHMALLEAINNGQQIPAFAAGGKVSKKVRLRAELSKAGANQKHLNDLRIATNEEISEVNHLRALAAHEMAEARRAMEQAPTAFLKQIGARLVRKWEQWAQETNNVADFLGGRTSSILDGMQAADDEDEKDKKKAKRRKEKIEKPDYTAQDDLNTINEMFPELQLSMEEYLRLSVETQQKIVEDAYKAKRALDVINKMRAGTPDAFRARQQFEKDRQRFAKDAAADTAMERTPFAALRAKFAEVGRTLSEDFYNILTPELVAGVEAFAERIQENTKAIADPSTSPQSRRISTILVNKLLKDFEKFQEEIKVATFGNAYEKFSFMLERAGVRTDEDDFNRATDAVRSRVKAIADRINKLIKDIREGTLSEAERIGAQEEIDLLREEAEFQMRNKNMSREAGKSFAADMHQNFSSGISEFIKTRDPKALLGIATRFTDRLIDDFVESFLTPITGEGGPLNKLFSSIGSRNWQTGEKFGSKVVGTPNNQTPVTSAEAVLKALGINVGQPVAPGQPGGILGSSGIINPLTGMQNCCCGGPLGNMMGQAGSNPLGRMFGKAGGQLADPLLSSAPQIGMTFADQLLQGAPEIGERLSLSFAEGFLDTPKITMNGAGASGGGLGSLFGGGGGGGGLAAILGNIAGIFLAKMFSDGGQVGVDGKVPRFSNGGLIPRFFIGGLAGGGMFGLFGMLASVLMGKKKNRKSNIFGGLLGMLGSGLLGASGANPLQMLMKLFSGGGKTPGFRDGGLVPRYFLGGLLGGGAFGALGMLASVFLGKKKNRKKNLFGGLLGMLGGGILGSMGGGGILGIIQNLFKGDGGAIGMAKGGVLNGPGNGTSDSILARVSTGEFIVNAKATRANLPILRAINDNRMPAFASGGMVGSPEYESASEAISRDTKAYNDSRSSKTIVNLKVVGDVTRQTRRTVVEMLPQIADGVNANNRETGYTARSGS